MDMETEMESVQSAELYDVRDACNELNKVIARLKRHSLLTDAEDRATRERIEGIPEPLSYKLPHED